MKRLQILLGVLLITLQACIKDTIPLQPYFPLDNGKSWCFNNYWGFNPGPDFQTQWKSNGEVQFDNITYKNLEQDGNQFKAIRVENGNYFKRRINVGKNTASEELLFLKTDRPHGKTWEQILNDKKFVFSQMVFPEVTIDGKLWKDVLQVSIKGFYKNSAGVFEPVINWNTQKEAESIYQFARGIGPVYINEPTALATFSQYSYAPGTEMRIMNCPQ